MQFTTRCAMCRGTMTVEARQSRGYAGGGAPDAATMASLVSG
jgi:hypothetical protein